MEFVYNQDEDGNTLDFYRRYSKSFPILAIITQGWHGDILEDTFDREQVLLITSHMATPHVYGTVHEPNEKTSHRTLSIPLNEDMLVTMVNKHFAKVGKEMQLREVLEKHKLPFMVKLTGIKTSSANHRFMKLLSVHHLVSMQGHFVNYVVNIYSLANAGPDINYDVMEPMAIKTLADAFDMNLSLSGDNKGMRSNAPPLPIPNRNQFVKQEATCAVERNTNIQNRPIPEIPPDIQNRPIPKIPPDIQNRPIPKIPPDIQNRPIPKIPPDIQNRPIPKIPPDIQNRPIPKTPPDIQNRPIPEIPPDYNLDSETEPNDSGWSSVPDSSTRKITVIDSRFKSLSPIPQNAPPPAVTQPPKSYRTEPAFGKSTVNMKNRPLPEIPKEVNDSISEHNPYRSGMSHQHSRNVAQAHHTTGRSKHSETFSHFPEAVRSAAGKSIRYTRRDNNIDNNSDHKERTQMHARSDPHNGLAVANLTVDDVTHWLRKLHLHEYIRTFKEQLIDGKLLCRLNERILIEEFRFSNTEAIRLMAFVREGHVPR
ncbi:hypothetical protein ACJMK2_019358 [Sinanodonta woodiana]|uniref:SAM domain-containing protein n=1 Tax=Sinanodonta woodiana TaxID=1069815 RepID=A0ABD3UI93_SINWO